MELHTNPGLFEEAIRATAQHLTLPMTYVEKDYWVTVALKALAKSDMNGSIVFKGGTSLSKAYGLISRFSEDVDIAVLTDSMSDGQVRRRVKKACGLIPNCFKEIDSPDTSKNSNFRKIRFQYPKLEEESEPQGQVTNSLLLEVNAFADPEPYNLMPISSYVADFLSSTGNEDEVTRHSLQSFQMNVLCTSRTLCEKIMGMVKVSCGDNHINDINKKIRHLYDIYYLMGDDSTYAFFESNNFSEMANRVIESDRRTFPNSQWINQPLAQAVVFSDLESIWGQLESTYNGDFKKMVVSAELPTPASLFEMTKKIHNQLAILDGK
ncbi:nucleotidyl transferase AbiEii/AbiGii toxin family protein [Glaciecola siphonariae]|uniref:Nucleotidyl transferase AbiEii/AbiGii toxin family protein n=1 Tax=Glaciecola siphonariae TaxID=521012 RepID=A0ABV9M0H7_9ALTE